MLLFWFILILFHCTWFIYLYSVFILTMRLGKKKKNRNRKNHTVWSSAGFFMVLWVSAELTARLKTEFRILGPCVLRSSFAIARVISISVTVRSPRLWSLEGFKTAWSWMQILITNISCIKLQAEGSFHWCFPFNGYFPQKWLATSCSLSFQNHSWRQSGG